MFVIAHRAHSFTVGNKTFLVQPGPHPQFLDDKAKDAPLFHLPFDAGDLVEVKVVAPAAEVKPAEVKQAAPAPVAPVKVAPAAEPAPTPEPKSAPASPKAS